MSISKFSIEQPVFVNLFMALIIIAGFFAFNSISKEEFPEISLNAVSITTLYPGVSPEEIEALITKPIEEEISDIDDIDSIKSFSSEGRSLVTVTFKIEATDIYRKKQEVQTEVDKVTGLPEDADDPVVKESKHFFHLITICVMGGGFERETNEVVEDMVYDFKKIYGISEVEVWGDREREVWVEVDRERLEGYALSLNDVISALRKKNLNVPAGTIKLSQDEVIVRTVGEVRALRDLADIVVRKNEGGGHVYIKDIARVSDTFEEPTVISKINGKKSINIVLRKGEAGNIVDIVREAKETALGYQSRLPTGAEIAFSNDKFSANGDSQGGQFILRCDTTDVTATVLTTNNSTAGSTNQIVAASDTCITFDGTITAMQNGAQAYASWKIEGLLVNDGGTTTLANSATTVIQNLSSWGMALSADNTNNALAITCTGEASHNIRWVANIRTTEVTYA